VTFGLPCSKFSIILGATEEEARKKATKATIEFSPDPQETGGIIYQVIHGNPMSVYRQPLQFGKPTKTLRSGKPVQVRRDGANVEQWPFWFECGTETFSLR
jgi:hypothetical protein